MPKEADRAAPGPPRRQPREDPEAAASTDVLKPSWLLQRMDLDGPWSWRRCAGEDLLEVKSKLAGFETMTWGQILQGTGSHAVSAEGICKEARDRLTKLRLDGVDTLVSLRLAGKQRVWGIRLEHRFQVMWWDPNHTVWPTTRR